MKIFIIFSLTFSAKSSIMMNRGINNKNCFRQNTARTINNVNLLTKILKSEYINNPVAFKKHMALLGRRNAKKLTKTEKNRLHYFHKRRQNY